MRKAVSPECSVQVVVGVVRGPDLLAMLGDRVAIHSGKDEVLGPHEGSPLLQILDGRGRGVVEEHGAE